MKLFHKRFTTLNLLILTLLVIIPVLVVAVSLAPNTPAGGYIFMKDGTRNKMPVYYNTTDVPTNIVTSTSAYCFSSNDYSNADLFIPTRTQTEFESFLTKHPITVSDNNTCCIDGICSASESTTSCVVDCGFLASNCRNYQDLGIATPDCELNRCYADKHEYWANGYTGSGGCAAADCNSLPYDQCDVVNGIVTGCYTSFGNQYCHWSADPGVYSNESGYACQSDSYVWRNRTTEALCDISVDFGTCYCAYN